MKNTTLAHSDKWLRLSVTRFLWPVVTAVGLVSISHAAESTPEAGDVRGPYVGIGLGVSKLGPRDDGLDGTHGGPPAAAKLYGGYQLTDTWGVEAGLVQLGHVHNDFAGSDGSTVRHGGNARSTYVAGTGRMALGSGFSLTGKLGVSFGQVSGKDSEDSQYTLGGHKASPMLGIGAEYKVNRKIALTLDLDGYGKVSEKVKASAATLGMRYSF